MKHQLVRRAMLVKSCSTLEPDITLPCTIISIKVGDTELEMVGVRKHINLLIKVASSRFRGTICHLWRTFLNSVCMIELGLVLGLYRNREWTTMGSWENEPK